MESSFVVRTFFFVVFGMSLDFSGIGDMTAISLGLGILLVVYLVRMFLFRAIVRKHIYPQVWIAPRGLVTILLFFSIPAALQDPNFSSTILMIVILVSGIIMSVALVSRKEDFEEMETLSFDDWNEIDKELEKLNPNTKQTGSDKKEIQR
jgi:cell volume regulation protein A